MSYYPRIEESTIQTLRIVRGMVESEGEGYLDNGECPYSPAIRGFLREISGGGEVGGGVNLFEDVDDVGEIDLLDVQIQKMLSQMEMLGNKLTDLEPNERLNFFKTRTSLMERLILMREKTTNLRDLMTFKAAVVQGLEDVCSTEQIAQFMERLDVR